MTRVWKGRGANGCYGSREPLIVAELVGGGPYDGRRIDRRGELPPELVLIWPAHPSPFGPPPPPPRYCTYRRIVGTTRFRYEAPE